MSEQPVRLFKHTDIDIKAAQVLLQQFDSGAELLHLQRIPEGLSTSNYIITLKNNNRKLLLKLYPENGGSGALEMAAYRYAAQFAKVPEVHWLDDSLSLFHRPYAILQYIEGVGLGRYIAENKGLPERLARRVGGRLAMLHGREYGRMALLDAALDVQKELLPVSSLHAHYLNGKPGSLISPEVRDDVLGYLARHPELTAALEERTVFCHGDFSPGNMIVDGDDEAWFIDFEYCLAAPPHYDIGKFFRDRPGISDRFGKGVYDGFIGGYNDHAASPLREDWYRLSRLMDMTSVLHLLNYDGALCWAGEIEEIIRHTMRILRGEE